MPHLVSPRRRQFILAWRLARCDNDVPPTVIHMKQLAHRERRAGQRPKAGNFSGALSPNTLSTPTGIRPCLRAIIPKSSAARRFFAGHSAQKQSEGQTHALVLYMYTLIHWPSYWSNFKCNRNKSDCYYKWMFGEDLLQTCNVSTNC